MGVIQNKLVELSAKKNLTAQEQEALDSGDPEDVARLIPDIMPAVASAPEAEKAKKAKK